MKHKTLRDALEHLIKAISEEEGKAAAYTVAYGGHPNLVVDYRYSMSYAVRVLKDRTAR